MKRSKSATESLDLSNNLCVDYLLNLENNEISRIACMKFLQRFVNNIHLGDSIIIKRNQARIKELGGEISPPTESKKFSIFKLIFGKNAARIVKKWFWNIEIILKKIWDKLLSYVSGNEIKY